MQHPEKASTEMVCQVHQHNVSCIAINQSGTKIATTSTKASTVVDTKFFVIYFIVIIYVSGSSWFVYFIGDTDSNSQHSYQADASRVSPWGRPS